MKGTALRAMTTWFKKDLALLQRAKHEGCKLLTGGGKQPGQDKGFYVAPTIFTDVKPEHQLWKEEVHKALQDSWPSKSPQDRDCSYTVLAHCIRLAWSLNMKTFQA